MISSVLLIELFKSPALLGTSLPNYDACKVDDTKSYSLDADFSKKRPVAFTFEGKRYDMQSWKRFIVMVCELLNDKNPRFYPISCIFIIIPFLL